jgi:hypothetical protein
MPMDTGELRKRILHALDEARRDSSGRRGVKDEGEAAFARFLENIAVPLVRQAVDVLRAERQDFAAHTPAGSVRLASERSGESFLEFVLDTSGPMPQVVGRVSVARARQGVVVEERPIAPGKSIADLADDDVAKFLVAEIPKLVVR